MAFQLISLGVHPFGEDRDNPTPWTGAVQLHSGFVAGGAEAWLRVFGPNGVLVTCRVAATATAVAGQAGPELTPELETFSGAFTLQAGDAMVTFRGPNHPDNQFLDASEPYTWNLGTQYNDITEWFNPAGAAEVFVSIWDGAPLVVEGDAQPAGYSLDVPPATGSLPLVVEGDAQPAGYSLDVPPATGSLPLVVEGDAQPAGYSLDVPPATGSLPLVVEGDAQPAGYSLDVPPATGSSRRSGDAQPAGYSLDVPPATGSSRRSGDAQPAGYSLDVPPAAGGISGTAEHLELATLRSLSGDGPIYAFEFTHPDMPDPVRIVSDGVDHVIEGDVYQAIAVSVTPPQSREGEIRRGQLQIDNVGRPLTDLIAVTEGFRGSFVRIMRVLRRVKGRAAVQSEITWETTMEASVAEVSRVISLQTSDAPTHGRPAVTVRHDPATSPGLF